MHKFLFSLVLFIVSFSSSAQSVIKIGAPLPLTGKLTLEAEKQQRGYELWADLINNKGGIYIGGDPHLVKIIYADYEPNSEKARNATEDLILKNKVNFLFAPYGSKATREASVVAEKYNIPMIAVTASSQQAYSRGHQYLFGIFTPNKTLIDPLLDLVKQSTNNINNVALLVRNDLFPLSIAREVMKACNEEEIDIVFYNKYPVGTIDHSERLLQVKKLNPEWIFALGYTDDLILLRQEMSKYNLTAPLLTMIAAPAYQEFIDATGILAENITSTAWWHPAVQYTGNDIFGTTQNFVQLFKSRYGKLPDYVEASAALAGTLFQLAIERANSIEGKLVREELALFDETTFWGPIKFGENGQNSAPSPLVFQIQNSKPVVISPTKIATGKLMIGIN